MIAPFRLVVTLSLLFSGVGALAAGNIYIVEPYVGFGMGAGETEFNLLSGTQTKSDVDFMQGMVGTRVSYYSNGLSLGVDWSYHPSAEFETELQDGYTMTWNSANIGKETFKASRSNLGVYAGFRSNFLIWGTYYPLAQLTVQKSSENDVFHTGDPLKGSGFGAGVGYTIYKHMILSFEYRAFSYEDDGTQASKSLAGLEYDIELHEFLAELSFPYAF